MLYLLHGAYGHFADWLKNTPDKLLVAGLADWVVQAAQASGLTTLAWGGGCFLNALLSLGLRQNLEQRGLTVLAPVRASPGDASLALGQAWVALNSLEQ